MYVYVIYVYKCNIFIQYCLDFQLSIIKFFRRCL